MNQPFKSCDVADPTQRNRATSKSHATAYATNTPEELRKPASIQELRAQLKAQQSRNQSQIISPMGLGHVARTDASCAVALPSDHNVATQVSRMNNRDDMVQEFMEVDGMTLEEAQAWEAQSVEVRPASEWIAMIQELDAAINHYCNAKRVSAQARGDMLATRMNQSLSTIPDTLAWFKNQLNERQT